MSINEPYLLISFKRHLSFAPALYFFQTRKGSVPGKERNRDLNLCTMSTSKVNTLSLEACLKMLAVFIVNNTFK